MTRVAGEHTPGQIAWFGNRNGVYLATTTNGRQYVMGFARQGMAGAQPTFRVGDRMRKASELVTFEVGNGEARGFAEAVSDNSVYRYDVNGIDAPDAVRLVACWNALEGIPTDALDGLMDEVRRVLSGCLPRNLCLTNTNVRDDTVVPLECTLGELRQIAALRAKLEPRS